MTVTKVRKHNGFIYRLLPNGMGDARWRPPAILWIPVILLVILLFFADISEIGYYSMPYIFLRKPVVLEQDNLKGFLIKTDGCRIPAMKEFDPSIIQYIENETEPNCNGGIPPLMDSDEDSVFLLENSLRHYKIEEPALLKCCYRSFKRRRPKKREEDKQVEFSKTCVEFINQTRIFEEFIKVQCTYKNTVVYTDYFAFVPAKNKVKGDKNKLNVLVIGLDAVSRLNFHRQMPKTVTLLQKLDFVELLGYNKVGDNTFPNLMPVLTGLSEEELGKTCWPSTESRFDECPFVWNNYKANNFSTAFAEDSVWMGIFNYNRKGFYKQPTDYFWGHFNYVSEQEIGNNHMVNVNRCVGSRQVYKTFLSYVNTFVRAMENNFQNYFAFFWEVSLSHDFLNTPKWGDGDFQELFALLSESGAIERTVVIFMSDHGIRWGGIRTTYQGRMEERLPFVLIRVPKSFRENYVQAYANLKQNSRRLTTPFDLHETLMNLVEPSFLIGRKGVDQGPDQRRAYSLFEKIPQERTCDDAGIAVHWCTCQTTVAVKPNDTMALQAAEFAVDYINEKLTGYAECANLTLDVILDARVQKHAESISKEDDFIVDYTVTFRTQPGGGVFEVTVRRRRQENERYRLEVTGTISRINLYGKQSQCVSDFHMKLYCYCKRLLGNET